MIILSSIAGRIRWLRTSRSFCLLWLIISAVSFFYLFSGIGCMKHTFLPFEVSLRCYPVVSADDFAPLFTNNRFYLSGRPYIEGAFNAFAISVYCGVEAAVGVSHFSQHPLQSLGRNLRKERNWKGSIHRGVFYLTNKGSNAPWERNSFGLITPQFLS